ncbi:helix-turn-helix transcriptional regulator [Haloarchaeobius sp. DFWS5]|uniref:helix-turn-helix transcriptional regulator n=1 Tax=Haloarchaeobius sp. DFWS5 TaxID=3446114 RepID=UPI003EB8DD23
MAVRNPESDAATSGTTFVSRLQNNWDSMKSLASDAIGSLTSADDEDDVETSDTHTHETTTDGIDREFMTTSEEILYVVELSGGRMWQSDIVDEVDASSSTVSRHLTSLEGDDEIQRVTVGREKIVALPDQEFEATNTIQQSEPAVEADGAVDKRAA